jgi:hypothetical protein
VTDDDTGNQRCQTRSEEGCAGEEGHRGISVLRVVDVTMVEKVAGDVLERYIKGDKEILHPPTPWKKRATNRPANECVPPHATSIAR